MFNIFLHYLPPLKILFNILPYEIFFLFWDLNCLLNTFVDIIWIRKQPYMCKPIFPLPLLSVLSFLWVGIQSFHLVNQMGGHITNDKKEIAHQVASCKKKSCYIYNLCNTYGLLEVFHKLEELFLILIFNELHIVLFFSRGQFHYINFFLKAGNESEKKIKIFGIIIISLCNISDHFSV